MQIYISQLQRTVPQSGAERRGQRGAEGLTITLLYSLSVFNVFLHRHRKTKTGKHSCGLRAHRDLRSFWLFLTPPSSANKHTLCFVLSVVLPLQQSATVVSAFSKKKSVHFDKRLAHSRRHELFIITELMYRVFFKSS